MDKLDRCFFEFIFQRPPISEDEFLWFVRKLDEREKRLKEEEAFRMFFYKCSNKRGKRDLSAYLDDDNYYRYDEDGE